MNPVFGKERKELEKFNKLSIDERSIVFYSEDISSFVHFEQIIYELTEKMGRQICYVTSDNNDPILTNPNKRIKTFYIGLGATRTKFFMELKAGILVMTMPNLETYYIKRSKVYPVHYVYIFHSIVSTHTIYRKGAFDHFDSIFCVGPHHLEEITAAESVYNLNNKNLIKCGYGLFDKLQRNKPLKNQKNYANDKKKNIIIAPSWGKKGLLETKGIELVKILLDAGYHVTVRPHPMTIKKSPKTVKQILKKFEKNPDFLLDTNTSSFEQLFSSYALITDWSGIGYEYAFVCERPVIYVDVPKKAHNKEYEKIGLVPFEINIRNQIGEIIAIQNIETIPERIEFLYSNDNNFENKIQKIRNDSIFNIGESGKVTANEIIRIIGEKRKQNSL